MEFIIFTKQSTGNSFDLKKNRFFLQSIAVQYRIEGLELLSFSLNLMP